MFKLIGAIPNRFQTVFPAVSMLFLGLSLVSPELIHGKSLGRFTIDKSATVKTSVAVPEVGYDCRVLVAATDLKQSMEATFKVDPKAKASHGGTPVILNFESHQVQFLVDSKWRGISWSRGDQVIAETVIATQNTWTESNAMVVYNPANTDEQVALTCDVTTGE